MEVDLETKLTKALHGNRDDEVIELCKKSADGPLCIFTIHRDTVLHQATYMKKFGLANQLLDYHLAEHLVSRLSQGNDWGNTLLHNSVCHEHEVVADQPTHLSNSEEEISFARKLLQRAPQILAVRNRWGESAVFQSARHGRRIIFEFLADKVDEFCASNTEFNHLHFFQRDDKITILHMSILTRNYDLAFIIASRYPALCNLQAWHGTTALHILASNPTAFKSGTKQGFLRQLIYSSVPTDDENESQVVQPTSLFHKAFSCILPTGKRGCIIPVIEQVREEKRGHEAALKLAKVLVRYDTSWRNTYKPGVELMPIISPGGQSADSGTQHRESKPLKEEVKHGKGESNDRDESEVTSIQVEDSDTKSSSTSNIYEIPLMLAASKGCIEIVEEILDMHPQAYEYRGRYGETLLHAAIKNRHVSILKLLQRKFHFPSLIYSVDNRGDSLLHMVGYEKEVPHDAKLKSPVLELSEDLILLEHLKKVCPSCLIHHRNGNMKTPDELFAMKNQKLREQAKEWSKQTAEHCTAVIVLIATVAFAAAYTVPGGPNQSTGVPLLIGHPFFIVFTLTDVLSLGFALTAVIVFLAILTSSFQMKDFRRSLPQKLLLGFTLLFLSVSMMMVSFAATIILTIHNKQHWTKIVTYTVAFFPVSIFALSYIPLYIQLAETLKYWIAQVHKSLPRCASGPACLASSRRWEELRSTSSCATHSV